MKSLQKHQFNTISLLTTPRGLLDVTIIPILGQPDWLIPSALILSIDDCDDYYVSYPWQDQQVAVYHLLPKDILPKHIIILEGVTASHRIALQTTGTIISKKVTIADVKDHELPSKFMDLGDQSNINFLHIELANDVIGIPFIYQTVSIEDKPYIVPDIDALVYQLLDQQY